MLNFLSNPDATPDTGCIQLTEPIDFSGDNPFAQTYFGTADLWD